MEELIKKVEQWSMERGLNTADPQKQRLKLWEEFGELCAAVARSNREGAIDAIGDMLVVMIIYCQQLNYPIKINVLSEIDVDPHESFKRIEMSTLAISTLADFTAFRIFQSRNFIDDIYQIIGMLDKIAERYDLTLEKCLQSAYNEIKDRKGKMINGVFVKEEDLNG